MTDSGVIEQIRSRGVAVLPGVINSETLPGARQDFDRAYREAGKGTLEPNTRVTLSGETLLGYPGLAPLYVEPQIMAVAARVLAEPAPWLWMIRANRYGAPHTGVRPHSDGFPGELAPSFSRLAVAIFLDDIDEHSGALTYAPGSHKYHYRGDDPTQSAPSQADIESASFVPVSLSAGDALLRIPEVWHAVNPIHRLRRYVAASFTTRGEVSDEMSARRSKTLEERRLIDPGLIPEEAAVYWRWSEPPAPPAPVSG